LHPFSDAVAVLSDFWCDHHPENGLSPRWTWSRPTITCPKREDERNVTAFFGDIILVPRTGAPSDRVRKALPVPNPNSICGWFLTIFHG